MRMRIKAKPRVTMVAPPRRVAMEQKGRRAKRLAAVRMATSPVPPCAAEQEHTTATSMGYMLMRLPTKKAVEISTSTVETTTMTLRMVKAETSLSQGVIEAPTENSRG